MQRHTPGPWKATAYSSVVGLPIMAQPDKTQNSIVVCGVRGDRETAEANAEFIVRACNGHDDLVAALTNLLNGIATGAITSDHDEVFENAVLRGRAAIRKATEG